MKNPFAKKSELNSTSVKGQEALARGEKPKKFKIKLFLKKNEVVPPVPAEADAPAAKKPAKEKKPKKDKPQKIKREKDNSGKKRRPVLLIALIGGAVVVVVAVIAILALTGGETVEEKLARAAQLTADAQYEEATTVYNELIAEDPLLADAYLGHADNDLAQEGKLDSAMLTLQQGLDATSDERIAAKLEEITPEPVPEGPPPPSAEPIVWKDAALEKMVRMAIKKPGTETITEADLDAVRVLKIVGNTHAVVDESLNTLNSVEGYTIGDELFTDVGEIRSLADIVHFKHLTKLVVGYNQVTDLSGITGMAELETLSLYFNNISDISALSGLPALKYLYIYNNEITDLSPIRGLTALKALYAQNNRIASIAPVSGLVNLSELYIGDNQITDLSPVSGLTNLHFLYASNNQITDISAVAGLPGLSDVAFDGNPVTDYSPAKDIQNVNRVY